MNTYCDRIRDGLRRNNLRALHVAILESICAWTPEACHQHVEHCEDHPREVTVTPMRQFHMDRLAENQLPALAWFIRNA